jgi:hypothetical protein
VSCSLHAELTTDTIQRSIAVDPDAVGSRTSADDSETAGIIMSLRQKLKAQTDEVLKLQSQLSHKASDYSKEVSLVLIDGS